MGQFRGKAGGSLGPEIPPDAVARRRVALWDGGIAEGHRFLALCRYWEALRPSGLLPAIGEFDRRRLGPILGTTSLVDVRADDPRCFEIRWSGGGVPVEGGRRDLLVGAVDCAPYRQMLMDDYRAAKEVGAPAYHAIAVRAHGVVESYERVILPFAADRRRVSDLYVCAEPATFGDLIDDLNARRSQ